MPTLVLTIGTTSRTVPSYSWCWQGDDHGCENVPLPDCARATSVLPVEPNAPARVTFSSPPSMAHVAFQPVGTLKTDEISLTRQGSFTLPPVRGRYLLFAQGRWPEGDVYYPLCLLGKPQF